MSMGADREPFFVPYGKPISLRIHPALLARLDHEVCWLNQVRPVRPVTRSGLIQQALRLLLDSPAERAAAEIPAASVCGIAEAQRHWQANGASLVAGHKARESRRRELWRRFEQACGQDQITLPDWLRLAARHDPGFDRTMLLAWYCVGELPEGGHGDRLMDLVEQWLKKQLRCCGQ
jgi:hypothetical protein